MTSEARPKRDLEAYGLLLASWNKKRNLISRNQTKNIEEHLADSLSVSNLLGKNIMDLGSGGGLPGIPLAIYNPQKNIYLVERNEYKASFLLHVITKLKLKNTKVIQGRSEDLKAADFPMPLEIVTRAFGSPKKAIEATSGILESPQSCLKMMKTEPLEGAEDLPGGYKIEKIENIETKEKDKKRILVTIGRIKRCTQ
ncbi:MAG: 16S rRNA (guanine(527)-N(7))-methyltransferase RsmG [Gammaproteobacteria bacterium]